MVEILHQRETHALCCSNGDKRIPTEIAEYLECEKEGSQKDGGAIVVGQVVKYRINVWGNIFCYTKFHEITPYHQPQAINDNASLEGMADMKLTQHVFGSFNRTGNKLGEEGNKKCVCQ